MDTVNTEALHKPCVVCQVPTQSRCVLCPTPLHRTQGRERATWTRCFITHYAERHPDIYESQAMELAPAAKEMMG